MNLGLSVVYFLISDTKPGEGLPPKFVDLVHSIQDILGLGHDFPTV